jgi:hypothetical protein
MPRVAEAEQVKIQIVTELVAECLQKCSEGSDFFPDGRPHPQPDDHRPDVVIAEQFGRPVLANSKRPSGEDADATQWPEVPAKNSALVKTSFLSH